jgi:protein SCO1/2
MAEPKPRAPWGIILAAGAAALAMLAVVYLFGPRAPSATETETASATAPAGCVLSPGDKIGGPISLIDQSGAPVTQGHFADGVTLIYFGYTSCPDVCPLSLQMEKLALDSLGQEGGVVQPVMISLDPARDTPAMMEAYVKSNGFPHGLIGLTGSQAQVAAAAKAFRVTWQRVDDPQSAVKYVIGHGSYFYLMDDEWRLRALFPSTLKPNQAAQCIRAGIQAADQPGQ